MKNTSYLKQILSTSIISFCLASAHAAEPPVDPPSAPSRARFAPIPTVEPGRTVLPLTAEEAAAGEPALRRSGDPVRRSGLFLIVQRGQCLSVIAQRLGISLDRLMAANRISALDADHIRAGQILSVPGISGGAGQAKAHGAPGVAGAPRKAAKVPVTRSTAAVTTSADDPQAD